MTDTRTLQRLVADFKGDRSYDQLARDCGDLPTGKRLQQIATSKQLKTFPDPPTIRGIARGLGVSETEVVLSAARSLGLRVAEDDAGDALVLTGAAELPVGARQALISLTREMLHMRRGSGKLAVAAAVEMDAAARRPLASADDLDDVAALERPGVRRRRDEVEHLDE